MLDAVTQEASLQELAWKIEGAMTHETIVTLLQEGKKRIDQASRGLAIDLSRAGTCDSSGVALCIELLRYARAQDKHVLFCNPPHRMLDMIRVSGVDSILPFKNFQEM